jgi:hypothetical protein
MHIDVNRWDEKAGLRRDAVGSQVIDVLEAQEIKEGKTYDRPSVAQNGDNSVIVDLGF